MISVLKKAPSALNDFFRKVLTQSSNSSRSKLTRGASLLAISTVLAATVLAPMQATPAKAADLLDLQYGALSFQPEPDFLSSTSNLSVGFNHTYSNVAVIGGQAIDSRVTVEAVSGQPNGEMYSFDQYDDTQNLSFHTQIMGTSSTEASGKVKVEFFESGTLKPVVLTNLRASIADIDAHEFARFYSVSSYTFGSPTSLSVKTPLVAGQTTFVSSVTGASNTDQTRIVQVEYAATSSFSVMFGCRAGAYSTVGLDGKCGFTIDIGTPVFTGATTVSQVAQPSYSLTYDANTGSGTPPATATVSGLTTISSPTNLTKQGYAFGGWTSMPDGTGILLEPNSSYVPTGPLTLYAKWVPANTVTFVNNGGTGVMADQTSSTPTSLTSNSFTRTGYDFAGWNTLADGTGTSYTDAASYAFGANLTLYAIWTPAPLRASSQTITVIPSGSGTFTALTGSTGLAGGGSYPLDPTLSCLVDPATLSCGTSVDTTDGHFELNISSGVVTYTNNGTVPAGGAGVSISYDVTDTSAATVSGTLSPIITAAPPAPTPPVATPEGITVAQGGTGTFTTITGTNGLSTQGSGAINSALTCLRDPSAISVCSTTVTTTDGMFTLDRVSGVVTYVNNGSTPTTGVAISYDVTDVNGLTASALLTPTITPIPVVVPTPPVVTPAPPVVAPEPPVVLPEPKPEPKPTPKPSARPDLKRGLLNQAVKLLPVSNDTKAIAPLVPTTIKLCVKDCAALAAAGSSSITPKSTKVAHGTWSVSPSTGAVTFMPAKDWFGKAMINYVMFDELGNPVESTLTVIIPAPKLPKLPKVLAYTGDDVQPTTAVGDPAQAATSWAQFALFASMLAALLLAVRSGLRRFKLTSK